MTAFVPAFPVQGRTWNRNNFQSKHCSRCSPPQTATIRASAANGAETSNPLEAQVRQSPELESTTTQYNDNLFAKACISIFRRIMRKDVQWESSQKGYTGMIEETRMLLAKKQPNELTDIVTNVLNKLFVAPFGPAIFRQFFSDKPRFNAKITPIFFKWLVGKNYVNESEDGKPGQGIKIEKCRFLEKSNCKGLCINMCKIPTENFFTNELGLPLRMTPDLEDFSCQMSFGLEPLPLEEDPAIEGSCLQGCSMRGSYKLAKSSSPCYATRLKSRNKNTASKQ